MNYLEALPHQVFEEDIYAGYRIPAGSTVFANTWYGGTIPYGLHGTCADSALHVGLFFMTQSCIPFPTR